MFFPVITVRNLGYEPRHFYLNQAYNILLYIYIILYQYLIFNRMIEDLVGFFNLS